MQSRLNPYIGFQNKAREAMEFYHNVFGGKLTLSTFGENGMSHTPADNDKIMHAMLEAENGIVIMASDIPSDLPFHEGSNISISLSGDNEKELTEYWEKLIVGGTINQPLVKAPWGDTFGMLTDKFGTDWMVNISGTKA